MAYIPLHHKYRPQTFADLVGQEAIAITLTNALKLQKIAPAYLFTGPRGTGKTSSARILAKSLNCMLSQVPTAQPCGSCDVCRSIALGAALDIIEIDAASNTGVDNIREIIERAQYAPVQCRYKVYIIDECLIGDSLVLTSNGWTRIDDRSILGQKVLSYNDNSCKWEWKQVLRWLDRGSKPTLTIKTTQREISCTGNHLIGTNRGWIKAQDLKPGMKILSPLAQSNSKQPNSAQSVPADVAQKYLFPPIYTQVSLFIASNPIGNNILTSKGMVSGQDVKQNSLLMPQSSQRNNSDSSMGHDWEMDRSPIPTSIANYPDWHTSLETIESVNLAGSETVYDLEVEDNHNFVANGLLVHNCHMLSTAAFNSLLKTLEEPPPHVVFVLATTDPQRVLPTIISRCQRFDYRRIPIDAMVAHLMYIAQSEGINIPATSMKTIAQIAQGGLRDAESLLDRLSLLDGEITPDRVWDAIGSVPERDLLDLVRAIAKRDPESLLTRTTEILERGKEPITVLQNLAGCYRDLLIAKTAPKRADLVALTDETWAELCSIATTWEISQILTGQQHLKDSEVQLKHSTQPRLWLEITLFGLLSIPLTGGSTKAIEPTPTRAIAPPPISTPPLTQPVGVAVENRVPNPNTEGYTDAQTPPSAPPNPQIEADPQNIPNLWKQVLQEVKPSDRSLFQDYGKLMTISEVQAVIAMKSDTMQKVATGKIPELSKAFSKVCGREILVKLEVAGKTTPPRSTLPPPPAPLVQPIVALAAPPEPPATSVPPPAPLPPPEEPDEEPSDFDRPPDSLDSDRAASMPIDGAEELESIDPTLELATEVVVKSFNGEIVDRTDAIFDRLIGG